MNIGDIDEKYTDDIHMIKNTLTKLNLRLSVVYAALVGNEIAQDGGLVKDIKDIENEMAELTKKVMVIEKSEAKRAVYIKIIWGMVGGIIVFILNYFFK